MAGLIQWAPAGEILPAQIGHDPILREHEATVIGAQNVLRTSRHLSEAPHRSRSVMDAELPDTKWVAEHRRTRNLDRVRRHAPAFAPGKLDA